MKDSTNTYFLVAFTFFLSFCFMMIPLGSDYKWVRPDLVMLVLIYWIVHTPSHIGVFFAFCVGLVFDLLAGTLFGSMGLIFSIVAYFTIHFRLRLRLYRFWQQFIVIAVLVACGQLLRLWIQMAVGNTPTNFLYWLPSITSALSWPFVVLILQYYRRSVRL